MLLAPIRDCDGGIRQNGLWGPMEPPHGEPRAFLKSVVESKFGTRRLHKSMIHAEWYVERVAGILQKW